MPDIRLKGDSHLPKKCFVCFDESPSKVMKNAFYFHLESPFCSQVI